MPTIEVSRETYDQLAERAASLQITVGELVEPVLRAMTVVNAPGQVRPRHLSHEHFERLLDALAQPLPDGAFLPDDFSRADIYHDHD